VTGLIARLYAQMWANFWTPSIWTLAALAAGFARQAWVAGRRHLERMAVHDATRRITADLYRHLAGREHPDAPDRAAPGGAR